MMHYIIKQGWTGTWRQVSIEEYRRSQARVEYVLPSTIRDRDLHNFSNGHTEGRVLWPDDQVIDHTIIH